MSRLAEGTFFFGRLYKASCCGLSMVEPGSLTKAELVVRPRCDLSERSWDCPG
ncbi:hypothetical protein J2T18_002185 [Paenibacillus polymyxa]|uniref:hypothetical protein n=1 Tax=Paenibacillus polymyxa TaxID=1406 RepID=UPI002793FAB2|nr:hypothetical protein [Paenibacillus polymyxa]MDQ0047902.1 hypothetical protein [Paenibacillus polymyxa]